jgi:hypothetical protein
MSSISIAVDSFFVTVGGLLSRGESLIASRLLFLSALRFSFSSESDRDRLLSPDSESDCVLPLLREPDLTVCVAGSESLLVLGLDSWVAFRFCIPCGAELGLTISLAGIAMATFLVFGVSFSVLSLDMENVCDVSVVDAPPTVRSTLSSLLLERSIFTTVMRNFWCP